MSDEFNYTNEDSEEELEEQPIDFSDWSQASQEEVRNHFVTPRDTTEIIVPVNPEKKLFLKLYIRELPITEQLNLLEQFFIIDSKTGDGKLKWGSYYAALYTRMVKKSIPPIPWKEARMYNKRFMGVLNKYLPSPFDIAADNVTGLPEKDVKNL